MRPDLERRHYRRRRPRRDDRQSRLRRLFIMERDERRLARLERRAGVVL